MKKVSAFLFGLALVGCTQAPVEEAPVVDEAPVMEEAPVVPEAVEVPPAATPEEVPAETPEEGGTTEVPAAE